MSNSNPFPADDELPDEEPDLATIDPFEQDPSDYEDINEFVKAEWPSRRRPGSE